MEKTIIRRETKSSDFDELSDLHPVLQRVYASRGILTKQELERGLEHLLSFSSLKGIDEAVSCLYTILQAQKRILIVGDFDTDGATSTALAVLALKSMGAEHVNFIVPNRFEYGYGLTPEIVETAMGLKPEVIITVDNGIASCAGVLAAKEKGCQVIITDHHLPANELPNADVIVNPNQVGDNFPSKNLAGVGVIFYVMLALRSYLRQKNWFNETKIPEPNMAQFLDLVALGTIADVVPLDRNNRILVHQGLIRIRASQCRPGILALLSIANRSPEKLIATDLGFILAPRLNAAGRLDDMSLGIECLISDDYNRAIKIAAQLNQLNQERKVIESDMQHQALSVLNKLKIDTDTNSLPWGLCLFDEHWHQGVIGILAGRIKDRYHRPTIVFAVANEKEIKGSARSIPGLHIRDVMDAVATRYPALISKFGGHAMAAGLTLERQHYDAFVKAFCEEVSKQLTEENLQQILHSDGALDAKDFTVDLALELREAGPFGQAFPPPQFDGQFEIIEQRIVGQNHLKLTLKIEQTDRLINAIAFNVDLKYWPNHRARCIEAVYRLDINEYNGQRNLQLIIENLQDIPLYRTKF